MYIYLLVVKYTSVRSKKIVLRVHFYPSSAYQPIHTLFIPFRQNAFQMIFKPHEPKATILKCYITSRIVLRLSIPVIYHCHDISLRIKRILTETRNSHKLQIPVTCSHIQVFLLDSCEYIIYKYKRVACR